MKHNYINQLGGGIYATPAIEIYEMPAENGFGGSNGAGLDDISGDNVIDDGAENWTF